MFVFRAGLEESERAREAVLAERAGLQAEVGRLKALLIAEQDTSKRVRAELGGIHSANSKVPQSVQTRILTVVVLWCRGICFTLCLSMSVCANWTCILLGPVQKP